MKYCHKKTLWLPIIFGFSTLLSFFVLNRWVITDIGFLSYGRVWQFYISYEDFGFVRRALLGTLFSITGMNLFFSNEYIFAIVVHHFAILTLSGLIYLYIIRFEVDDMLFVATCAFSPALIIQAGYTTGSLDIFVLIFAAINILYPGSMIRFSLITFLGTFTHEVFIFTIPAQLLAYFMALRGRGERVFTTSTFLPIASIALSISVIVFFGATDLSQDMVEITMKQKIPNAAGQHGLWSGYFEISKSVPDNIILSITFFVDSMRKYFLYISIPIVYTVIVTARLLSYSNYRLEKFSLALSTAFPLLASIVATDLYRWIGLSSSVGLLLTLVILADSKSPKSRLTYVLLPFSLLAPFGSSQVDWPFPAHQFILERLFQ